jgi:putative ABC transport system ATP-binding protein
VPGALEQVNRELGTPTAIITHNATIAAMADRVITMSQGTVKSVQHNEARKHADEIEW